MTKHYGELLKKRGDNDKDRREDPGGGRDLPAGPNGRGCGGSGMETHALAVPDAAPVRSPISFTWRRGKQRNGPNPAVKVLNEAGFPDIIG